MNVLHLQEIENGGYPDFRLRFVFEKELDRAVLRLQRQQAVPLVFRSLFRHIRDLICKKTRVSLISVSRIVEGLTSKVSKKKVYTL